MISLQTFGEYEHNTNTVQGYCKDTANITQLYCKYSTNILEHLEHNTKEYKQNNTIILKDL